MTYHPTSVLSLEKSPAFIADGTGTLASDAPRVIPAVTWRTRWYRAFMVLFGALSLLQLVAALPLLVALYIEPTLAERLQALPQWLPAAFGMLVVLVAIGFAVQAYRVEIMRRHLTVMLWSGVGYWSLYAVLFTLRLFEII